MSFALIPPLIWRTDSHCVCFSGHLLETIFPSGTCIAGVTLDELAPMGLAVYPWIQFLFICLPSHLCFYLIILTHVYCPMLKQACNGGCQGLVGFHSIFLEATNWVITSLSDKSACSRLFSAEAKSSLSSAAWLACYNPDCVSFKRRSSLNLLYSNARNVWNWTMSSPRSAFYVSICKNLCRFQTSLQHYMQILKLVLAWTVCLPHWNIVPHHWLYCRTHRLVVTCPRIIVGIFSSFLCLLP